MKLSNFINLASILLKNNKKKYINKKNFEIINIASIESKNTSNFNPNLLCMIDRETSKESFKKYQVNTIYTINKDFDESIRNNYPVFEFVPNITISDTETASTSSSCNEYEKILYCSIKTKNGDKNHINLHNVNFIDNQVYFLEPEYLEKRKGQKSLFFDEFFIAYYNIEPEKDVNRQLDIEKSLNVHDRLNKKNKSKNIWGENMVDFLTIERKPSKENISSDQENDFDNKTEKKTYSIRLNKDFKKIIDISEINTYEKNISDQGLIFYSHGSFVQLNQQPYNEKLAHEVALRRARIKYDHYDSDSLGLPTGVQKIYERIFNEIYKARRHEIDSKIEKNVEIIVSRYLNMIIYDIYEHIKIEATKENKSLDTETNKILTNPNICSILKDETDNLIDILIYEVFINDGIGLEGDDLEILNLIIEIKSLILSERLISTISNKI